MHLQPWAHVHLPVECGRGQRSSVYLVPREVSRHDWVLRFNYMDNLMPGEPLDVWVGRTDLLQASHFHNPKP
jgi:hypothetical protein